MHAHDRLAKFPESRCGSTSKGLPVVEPEGPTSARTDAEEVWKGVRWSELIDADRVLAAKIIGKTIAYGYSLDPRAHPGCEEAASFGAGRSQGQAEGEGVEGADDDEGE